MHQRFFVGLAFFGSLTTACAPVLLPARTAPEPVAVSIPVPAALPSPYGRVIVDVADGPANVQEVTGHTTVLVPGYGRRTRLQAAEITRPLCVTPCVVDLPYGPRELKMTLLTDARHNDSVVLNFTDVPKNYRHNLGFHDFRWRRLGTGMILTIVAVTVSIPLLTYSLLPGSDGSRIGFGVAAGVTLLGFGIPGVWLWATSRPIEQRGAGIEWPLASSSH